MDLSRERDRDSFWRAWRTHQNMLRPFRQSYLNLVEEYVGSEYASESEFKRKRTMMNLMFMAAETQTLALSANRPRVLVTTRYQGLRSFANKYQVSLNHLLEEIRFEKNLRRVVLDAFFTAGFMKTYYAPGQKIQVPNPDITEPGLGASDEDWATYRDRQNIWIDPGSPFSERVSIKDIVFDMSAECWEKIRYVTHQYRVPYEWALEDDRLNNKILKQLGPNSKWGTDSQRDSERTTADLSRSYDADHDELEPMITLADVWLAAEKRWAIVVPNDTNKPLYEDKWEGPDFGPFRMLSLADVPDNIMPSSPAQQLKNLHTVANQMLRKSARQALNQKTVAAYTGDGKDARAIRDTDDLGFVRVNNQDSVREHKFNGADRMTLAFGQVIDGLFNRAAGNLDARMGTGQAAETATQESFLQQAMGSIDARKQIALEEFVSEVASDLGFLLWNDHYKEFDDVLTVPGIEVQLPIQWKPDEREGDFPKYGVKIESHSTMYKTPSQRMAEIIQLIQQVYTPLMPFLVQSGGQFDMQRLTEMIADLRDLPRLKEIVTFVGGPAGNMDMNQFGQNQPHEYIRRNVPGGEAPQDPRNAMSDILSASQGEEPGLEMMTG